MAASKDNKENMVEVTAKVNIRYDKVSIKANQKFEIRESDLEGLKNKGYISHVPPTSQELPQTPSK